MNPHDSSSLTSRSLVTNPSSECSNATACMFHLIHLLIFSSLLLGYVSAELIGGQQEDERHASQAELAEKWLDNLLLQKFGYLFLNDSPDPSLESNPTQDPTPSDDFKPDADEPQASATITTKTTTQTFPSSNGQLQPGLVVNNNLAFGQGSPLDSRNDNQVNGIASDSEQLLRKRRYFRLYNRVFSRAELPDLFKSPKSRANSYCASHIGCLDDIPGLPAILRRSNISATFTIYTTSQPRGLRIPFEPLPHHQLEDANITSQEIVQRIHNINQPSSKPSGRAGQSGAIFSGAGARLNVSINTNQNPRPALTQSSQRRASGPLGARISAKSWQSGALLKRVQEFPFDLSALEMSGFRPNVNTRVIIGGYFAKEDEHWIEDIVLLWRKLDPNSNIIKVSWPEANRGLYHSAALNSRVVGRQLSLFLHHLDQMFSIDLSNKFHLVGHSLGAHIAGFVGADNGGRLARITGLDPAGPIFVDLHEQMRLDPGDAHFVDVLHTNAGSITKGSLGLTTPSGHVDYYPNGGSVQPGCYGSSMSLMDPVERVACNHRRSYRYFIEILKLTIEQQQQETPARNKRRARQQQAQKAILSSNDSNPSLETPTKENNSNPRPTAFLFEAKRDELDRLLQPDLLCLDTKLLEASHRSDECEAADVPARRLVEFHLMRPEFPTKKRGLYFFRTRPESPFFG